MNKNLSFQQITIMGIKNSVSTFIQTLRVAGIFLNWNSDVVIQNSKFGLYSKHLKRLWLFASDNMATVKRKQLSKNETFKAITDEKYLRKYNKRKIYNIGKT